LTQTGFDQERVDQSDRRLCARIETRARLTGFERAGRLYDVSSSRYRTNETCRDNVASHHG
jgi:hypothetical protein